MASLPYDAEVEYLESTGTQYIDTGVKFSVSDEIKISFTVTSASPYAAILGAGNADGDAGASYSIYLQYRAQIVFQCTGARGAAFNYAAKTRYDVSCSVLNGAMSVDGVPCGTNGYPLVSCDYNAYLFARNVAGAADRKGKLKVYSFSIPGRIDLIPVRFTNSNGQSEGAMYDRVSRKLFRNAGTGAFTIGPDVATPVMGLHYMPQPPWKNPYVTDGLIAMWDGEWPSGVGGQTEQTASEWVDLIHGSVYGRGTNILYNASGKYFDTNKIGVSDAARFNFDPIQIASGITIEVVFSGTFSTGTYRNFVQLQGYTIIGVGLSDIKLSPMASSYYTSGLALDTPIYFSNSISAEQGGNKIYVNGEFSVSGNAPQIQVSFASSPNQSANNVSGDLYAVRVYSRVLTAAEVAANYAVDKVRFGLP